MPEFSNQDLDNLFQRGSERYEFEFNPEAWRQMEALLERRRRRALLWWWFLGLLAGALILWGGYCYMSGKNQDLRKIAPEANAEIRKNAEGENRPAAGQLARPENGHGGGPEGVQPGFQSGIRPEAGLKSARPEPGPGSRGAAGQAPESGKTAQEAIKGASREAKDSVPQAFNPQKGSAESIPTAPEKGFPERSMLSEINLLPSRQSIPDLRKAIPDPGIVRFSLLPPRREAAGSGFLLSLNGAPQISSVGPGDPGPLSLRVGLGVEYRFGRNWSLGAGVYRVKKRYTAGEGEYIPPKGFWVRQIAPEYSVGWCDVLELPLYGGYYLSGFQSNGPFLEAGITSLYMREEWYYYHYKQNAPDLIHYWEARNENHAWLSLLHLSPGFQLVAGKLWRFQVAPYVQVPLGGVGHGNLRLYSLGLNTRIGIFKARIP